jgi:hypothetical protein
VSVCAAVASSLHIYTGGVCFLNPLKVSEQIKALCTASDISIAELARRVGHSPQGFNGKLKRESFKIEELDSIAEAVDGKFERKFILSNGEKI